MTAALWHRFEEIARRRETDPAIMAGDDSVSFRSLHGEAANQAAGFRLAPGERAVIYAANGPLVAAAVAGIWRCGAIPVMVNREAPVSHLLNALKVAEPSLVLVDGETGIPADARVRRLGTAPDAGPPPPAEVAAPETPASVVFTSGSTGMPKGATQSVGNLLDGAARIASLFEYGPDDRILTPVPFAFDYGWGQLLSLLLEGTPLVLPVPGNGFGICAALERHAPTIIAGVPSVLADLLCGLAPVMDTPRSSVRLVTNTGSKVPPAVFDRLLEIFPDARISLNYGLTETYRSASLPAGLAQSRPHSVGHAVPGVEIGVVRPDGSPAAPGEEGEILHRGAGTFIGYWNDPEATAKVLRPDPSGEGTGAKVVFTGDLGRIDEDGLLYVHGRRDRQIKSMGVRVSPEEIELLLAGSGLIGEVAVGSVPNDTVGDLIVAYIGHAEIQDEKALLRQLKAHARKVMSPYMQPRQYVLVDRLPRTPSGKIDYQSLAALSGDDRGASRQGSGTEQSGRQAQAAGNEQ